MVRKIRVGDLIYWKPNPSRKRYAVIRKIKETSSFPRYSGVFTDTLSKAISRSKGFELSVNHLNGDTKCYLIPKSNIKSMILLHKIQKQILKRCQDGA